MSPILESILEKRGIRDVESFFNPTLEKLPRPETLNGVAEAVGVILEATAADKQIVIFGDYDCDGISATAIMLKALSAITKRVEAFLPDRLTEGYGMSDASVERMLKEFPEVGLVITVDNGINSVKQIAELSERGVEVVVTDHHLPGETLPAAKALINPKVAAPEGLSEICGAAVAFLLANGLIGEARRRGLYKGDNIGGPLLVMAGLATVTDIMPLLGINRILVAEALAHFKNWAPMGLKELYARASRIGADRLTSRDFGFMIGPRINAAGRIANAMEALELVTTDDREIAREAARLVDLHNTERKTIEQKMSEQALAQVVEGAASQVIHLPEGHPGVSGIVAARLLERLGVPICVLSGGHGSARAPEGVNIRDAFIACDEVLERYGGHAAAGGFSVKDGRVDEFRAMLDNYCRQLNGGAGQAAKPTYFDKVDMWVKPEEMTIELAEEVQKMEPFGEANPEPLFGFEGVGLSDVKPLGSDGRHLAFTLPSGLRAVWWNHGDKIEVLRKSCNPFKVVGSMVISEYGDRHVELKVVDVESL